VVGVDLTLSRPIYVLWDTAWAKQAKHANSPKVTLENSTCF